MSKIHWVALAMIPGIGGTTLRLLVGKFGSAQAVFEADEAALSNVPRVTKTIAQAIHDADLSAVEAKVELFRQEGIHVIIPEDEEWPVLLRSASDAPAVLFVKGSLLESDAAAVAVVGTRSPTERGLKIGETVGRELAARGLTIVSGLAEGIDTSAHGGALRTQRGRTLAVLGSGIRVVHPASNAGLAEEITRRGALLSELHPDAPPGGPQLMARDRIVAALSRAVIVVEAHAKSGSLDTAKRARKHGRLVFAIPGSEGTDELIASGAERLDERHMDFPALARRVLEHEPPEAQSRQKTLFC